VGTPGTYSFSIRNGAVTPTFSALDTATTEGNGGTVRFAMVPVVLSAASSTSVSVQYATVDGSALAGQDYVAQRGILTFAPGVTSQNVFIELVGDTTPEQDENFILRLSGASGAPISSSDARVTIVNDDGLTISDVQRLEGTSTTPTTFAFTVTLLSAATAPVTVNWATQAGTAVAATDFTPASGTLTFAAGETQKTINVSVAADTTVEADETFSVVLSGASGAAIANGTGTATILNDDGFSIDDLTVVEGTDGTTQNALVTIRLLGVATAPVSVNWTATPGTATAPADFTAASGTVTFAVGETTKTVAIPIVRDSVVEGTETLTVRLSGATGTTIVRDTATVTIIDDDGFSVADAAVNEGNSGTTSLGFTVSLGSALAMGSTVAYAVTGGTATAGTDFTAASGTLTFAPGVTTQTVNVAVIGDVTFEADETLALTLSNPNGTGLSRAVATGTIFNDDGFRVGSATVTEGNSGTVNVVVPVTLGSAATGSVTVRWATADGTATAGEDYTAASGTLTFAPGTVSQNVTVAVRGDTLFEPNETFRIVLSDPVGTGIVVGSGTVTITNDDVRPPPSLRIVDAAISEGTGSGTTLLRFLVTLSEASTSAVTVNFATTPGTATAGTDYTTASGTLTIPAGNLFGFVEVPVIRDAVLEADETLTVTLSGATGGATIAIATAVGTILNDDVIIGTDGADSLNGTAGADAILGGLGNDTLAGGDGDDSLDGGGGDDSLSGGAGADTMAGSAGNDVFLVNDASDLVLEVAGGGADTIITSLAMSSREHVEALRIADGVSGITLTGSAGNDILVGNVLANRIRPRSSETGSPRQVPPPDEALRQAIHRAEQDR
jgi:chitinase